MDFAQDRKGVCRHCGAELDILLAPALAVVAGKVVCFCSDQCKKEYLERLDDGGDAGMVPPVDGRGGERIGETDGQRPKSGLFSWLKNHSSRTLLVVSVGAAAVLGLLGYHLACVVRYRPTVKAGPAEASLPRRRGDDKHKVVTVGTKRSLHRPTRREVFERAQSVAHELLHKEGYRLQVAAAEALMRCCSETSSLAEKVLFSKVQDPLWTRRRLAAEALARLGNPKGRQVLDKDLASPRRSIRLSAALSLARLGQKSSLPVLRSFVGAKRYQLTCAEALLHLGSARAQRILWRITKSESSPRVDRVRAAAALAGKGDQQAAAVLARLVAKGPLGWPEVLAMARAGLSTVDDRLRDALRYPALRVEASRILAVRKIGADPTVLWQDLQSRDEEAKATAAVAALWLGTEAR